MEIRVLKTVIWAQFLDVILGFSPKMFTKEVDGGGRLKHTFPWKNWALALDVFYSPDLLEQQLRASVAHAEFSPLILFPPFCGQWNTNVTLSHFSGILNSL